MTKMKCICKQLQGFHVINNVQIVASVKHGRAYLTIYYYKVGIAKT